MFDSKIFGESNIIHNEKIIVPRVIWKKGNFDLHTKFWLNANYSQWKLTTILDHNIVNNISIFLLTMYRKQ